MTYFIQFNIKLISQIADLVIDSFKVLISLTTYYYKLLSFLISNNSSFIIIYIYI